MIFTTIKETAVKGMNLVLLNEALDSCQTQFLRQASGISGMGMGICGIVYLHGGKALWREGI